MKGNITKFYGQAMTGQGVKHVYKELLDEAEKVYFLKGIFGFNISNLLKEIGYSFIRKGKDIEFFYDPLFENTVQATFVTDCKILFLQSENPFIQPTLLGTRDQIIPFFDCIDNRSLSNHGDKIAKLSQDKAQWYKKCFESLASAITIHDDWEAENQRHMNWEGLNKQRDELMERTFRGKSKNKTSMVTHRLLGTLTPEGAQDTLQNITRNINSRLFIKGYPGTGKSSLMKSLAKEAQQRGFDVQYVWCGLDANSIDMVIIPELDLCIFDSTEPHQYFPEENRPGDELFDLSQHCNMTKQGKEAIDEIVEEYKKAIRDATTYVKKYAEAEKGLRIIFDCITIQSEWNKKAQTLLYG